jgi:hypothetical protein
VCLEALPGGVVERAFQVVGDEFDEFLAGQRQRGPRAGW